MKILMKFRKTTKNTFVFDQVLDGDDEVPSIPTLYIRKAAFEGGSPLTIEVTVDVIS